MNITTLQAVAGGISLLLVLSIVVILRVVLNRVVLTVQPKPELPPPEPSNLLEAEETKALPGPDDEKSA